MDLDGIGDRIARLRRDSEMTQAALASVAGLHVRALQELEAGRKAPAAATLARLALALGTSADYLLGLTDDPLPHGDSAPLREALLREAQAASSYVQRRKPPLRGGV